MTSEIYGSIPAGGAAPLSRRATLARLGLSASAVHIAPVVLHPDRGANAQVVPTPCACNLELPAWYRGNGLFPWMQGRRGIMSNL